MDVAEVKSPFGGAYQNFGGGNFSNPYGKSRFDAQQPSAFASTYETPGWQRAQRHQASGAPLTRGPVTIDATPTASSSEPSNYDVGDRVFHQKFGPGRVTGVDGNKLTIDFERAGRKRVVDSFVARR